MKIGLIDVDSKTPNLALMKISAYYKKRGDSVKFYQPLFDKPDLIYSSKIFSYTEDYKYYPKNTKIIKGGSGLNYNLLDKGIEHIMPDYDLYNNMDYSLGFTTRGCIRKCCFCIVPDKEGKIKENADIYEFWNKKHKKIILLDNNVLAALGHFEKTADQIIKENLYIDYNQGLDHGLLTLDNAKILKKMKHYNSLRFAYDDINMKNSVLKAIDIIKIAGFTDYYCRWYLYVSPNDTPQSVYERMTLLKNHKQGVYVMRDRKVIGNEFFEMVSQWGNYMGVFKLNDVWLPDLIRGNKKFKRYGHFLYNKNYSFIKNTNEGS